MVTPSTLLTHNLSLVCPRTRTQAANDVKNVNGVLRPVFKAKDVQTLFAALVRQLALTGRHVSVSLVVGSLCSQLGVSRIEARAPCPPDLLPLPRTPGASLSLHNTSPRHQPHFDNLLTLSFVTETHRSWASALPTRSPLSAPSCRGRMSSLPTSTPTQPPTPSGLSGTSNSSSSTQKGSSRSRRERAVAGALVWTCQAELFSLAVGRCTVVWLLSASGHREPLFYAISGSLFCPPVCNTTPQELQIGPLLKHPLVIAHFHPPPSVVAVPEVTTAQIAQAMWAAMTRGPRGGGSGGEESRMQTQDVLRELLRIKGMPNGDPLELCVRITGVGLYIKALAAVNREGRMGIIKAKAEAKARVGRTWAHAVFDHQTPDSVNAAPPKGPLPIFATRALANAS